MARYPQSQTRALMNEKEAIARRLLARGLTVNQICSQLHCSTGFVYRIQRDMLRSGSLEQRPRPTGTRETQVQQIVREMELSCHRLALSLRAESQEQSAFHDAQTGLTALAEQLETGIDAYASLRGRRTSEGSAAVRLLTMLMRDLDRAREGTLETARERYDTLLHALHCASNAVTLLRWSAST